MLLCVQTILFLQQVFAELLHFDFYNLLFWKNDFYSCLYNHYFCDNFSYIHLDFLNYNFSNFFLFSFGEIVKSLFQNSSDESFGGSLGLETPRYDKNYLFLIAFLLVLL